MLYREVGSMNEKLGSRLAEWAWWTPEWWEQCRELEEVDGFTLCDTCHDRFLCWTIRSVTVE